jgi:hypothetical protein
MISVFVRSEVHKHRDLQSAPVSLLRTYFADYSAASFVSEFKFMIEQFAAVAGMSLATIIQNFMLA